MAVSKLSTSTVDKETRTSVPTSATRTTARGSAMKAIIFFLICIAFIVFGIWYELMLWDECRTDHSWMYCLRVITK
jgi:hypothetical protein